MGFWAAIPIIDRITKWIDEWKQNAALRKQKKVTALRVELEKVKGELKTINAMDKDQLADNIDRYEYLLRRKRLLEGLLQSLAG